MNDLDSPLNENFDEIKLEEFDHVGGKRLQIITQIGKSKHAAVFSAIDRNTTREVAAKIIECYPEGDSWRIVAARITREVNAWTQVEKKSSNNILQLYDLIYHRVKTTGSDFVAFILIMQLAPLGDLKKYIKGKHSNGLELSMTRLRTFLFQIAEGLEVVHASGRIHKDIKASNILLFEGRADADGKSVLSPKLADFGIAESVFETSHGVEGTPEYMAPEAFSIGYQADFASDIYSLGILFIEIITGHLPHMSSALSPTEKFAAYETLHKSNVINFSNVMSKMGTEMTNLVKDMLSQNPKERPTIQTIVTEIQRQIVLELHGEAMVHICGKPPAK